MQTLERIRQLPLAQRRLLALAIVSFVGLIVFVTWASTGFGLSQKSGGVEAISEGAGSVAGLIQEQTEKFGEDRAQLEADLQKALKSSALVLPEGLADLEEEPDGVLFLTNEFRARGTLVRLKQIEFYPSTAVVTAEVTNESNETSQEIIFDASVGSILQQNIPGGSELSFTPLFQSGSPVKLAAEQTQEVAVVFGPINGRIPFTLVLGDFMTGLDTEKSGNWSAQFTIDPSKIVQEKP